MNMETGYHRMAVGMGVIITVLGILLGYSIVEIVPMIALCFIAAISAMLNNLHDAVLEYDEYEDE